MTALVQAVSDASIGCFSDMQRLRRRLHQQPELSGAEYRTTEHLAALVAALGLKPVIAGDRRGLFVDIGGAGPGDRIAVRADIDALPITTQSEADYASRVDGVMHACGHDVHSAIGFGVVRLLTQLATSGHPVNARVIFQPEEETSRGGLHMIDSGALQEVAAVIALHVDPAMPVGSVGVRDGSFTAGCDMFECRIAGSSGHSARPHLTSDTVAAAAQWISDVYRRAPRVTDSRDAVVVNVGTLQSGVAANVVPATAIMTGTLRSLSDASSQSAKQIMKEISAAIASLYRCQCDLTFGQHTPPVINDPVVNQLLRSCGNQVVGEHQVLELEKPSMGAEDFAFMGRKVPAAMFRLGVAGDGIGHQPLHTSRFDVDESAMRIGVNILTLACMRWSGAASEQQHFAKPQDASEHQHATEH